MKQTGTLIGAPIRVNDDQDTYASAHQNEIQGGFHSVATTADRDVISPDRRLAGMRCYVAADLSTYRLKNDLVTWVKTSDDSGDSYTDPASGSGSASGAAWQSLTAKSDQIAVEQLPLLFKRDFTGDAAIIHLQGQFLLLPGFTDTQLIIGSLGAENAPPYQLKRWMVCQAVEMFVTVEANGDVTLISKDGFTLPSGSDESYSLQIFYKPAGNALPPPVTTYSATRTGSFTRNNCGEGYTGSAIEFTQTYNSTISQQDAEDSADNSFPVDGQNFVNNPDNGATCTVSPDGHAQYVFTNHATVKGEINLVKPDGQMNVTTPFAPGYTRDYGHYYSDATITITTHSPSNFDSAAVDVLFNGVLYNSNGTISFQPNGPFIIDLYDPGTAVPIA